MNKVNNVCFLNIISMGSDEEKEEENEKSVYEKVVNSIFGSETKEEPEKKEEPKKKIEKWIQHEVLKKVILFYIFSDVIF